MKVFLETQRLILRYFTEADVDNLYELDSDPEVMRYINGGMPSDRAQISSQILPNFLKYYDNYEGYGYWAVDEKSSGEFIGWFHFRPPLDGGEDIELGYRFKKAFWGKGYGTEGAIALIQKGFTELGTERVFAKALAVNSGSIRVMEKAGLKFDKSYIEMKFAGSNKEAVKYAIDKNEFDNG